MPRPTRPTLRLTPLLLLLAVCLPASASLAQDPAQDGGGQKATVELLVPKKSVKPGETIDVGVKMTMQPGWHIYWKNPGDSGQPPRFSFSTPGGGGRLHAPRLQVDRLRRRLPHARQVDRRRRTRRLRLRRHRRLPRHPHRPRQRHPRPGRRLRRHRSITLSARTSASPRAAAPASTWRSASTPAAAPTPRRRRRRRRSNRRNSACRPRRPPPPPSRGRATSSP